MHILQGDVRWLFITLHTLSNGAAITANHEELAGINFKLNAPLRAYKNGNGESVDNNVTSLLTDVESNSEQWYVLRVSYGRGTG